MLLFGVALPVALQGKVVVGGSNERIADRRIAAAQPVDPILVGVAWMAANDVHVVEADVARVAHLHLPGAAAHDAGNAVDLDVFCPAHHDAVPGALLHPPLIAGRRLRAVVEDHPAALNAHIVHLPEIERAKDHRARGKINAVTRVRVDLLMVNARTVIADVRRARRDAGAIRRAAQQEEHGGIGKVIAGPRRSRASPALECGR